MVLKLKKKNNLSTIIFQRQLAAVKLSDWNSIDENETCDVKNPDSARFVELDSTRLESAGVLAFHQARIIRVRTHQHVRV